MAESQVVLQATPAAAEAGQSSLMVAIGIGMSVRSIAYDSHLSCRCMDVLSVHACYASLSSVWPRHKTVGDSQAAWQPAPTL